MERQNVVIEFMKTHPDFLLPKLETKGSVGYDAMALQTVILEPFKAEIISLGFKVKLPEDYELQVRARSGLSLKGIIIPNSVGTIDSDYRGDVCVALLNLNSVPHTIPKGMRICQLVPKKCYNIIFKEVKKMTTTHRGTGGFGSTGLFWEEGFENEGI